MLRTMSCDTLSQKNAEKIQIQELIIKQRISRDRF